MANPHPVMKNWKTQADKPLKVRREIARKGAAAATAVKRHRKTFKECLEWALQLKSPQNRLKDLKEKYGKDLPEEELNILDGIILQQVDRALNGDTQSAAFVRDSAGQKPVEQVQQTSKIEFAKPLTKQEVSGFNKVLSSILNKK